MKEIIESSIDFFDGLPTWQKWLGTGAGGILIFFIFLLIFAGSKETMEIAEIPVELKEIQIETTKQYIEETKGPAIEIIKDFWKIGDTFAKDMSDPILGWIIRILWLFLGIIIAGMVVIIPVLALYNAFKKVLG